MNKEELTEEYLKMLNNQAPDLWGRIEQNLPVMENSEKMNDSNLQAVPVSGTKKKRKMIQYFRLAGSMAACILALVLAIPVMHIIKNFGESGVSMSESSETTEDTDVAEETTYADAAVPEQEAGAADEETQSSGTAQIEADAAEAVAEESKQSTESKDEGNAGQEEMSEVAQSSEQNSKDDSLGNNENSAADTTSQGDSEATEDTTVSDGLVYSAITVSITGSTSDDIYGTIYTASVIESNADGCDKGSSVTFVPAETITTEIALNATYLVTLVDESPELSDNHPWKLTQISVP